MNLCCLPERNIEMEELEQEEQKPADKWRDVRDGINDAVIELVSALDEIIEEIEGPGEMPSPSNLDGIDDPAGMLQMHLEQLYELHQAAKCHSRQLMAAKNGISWPISRSIHAQ